MALRGNSIPKADAARRNKPTYLTGSLRRDGGVRGPELPSITGGWCEQTRMWWEEWRRSPQAQKFQWTDWEFLKETAILHNMLWGPSRDEMKPGEVKSIATELRVRISQYGYSDMDRQRLRISIEGAVEPPVAYEEIEQRDELAEAGQEDSDSTVKLADYRQRLSGGS